jgi:arsenate reductase-like glutaredoxin family protein
MRDLIYRSTSELRDKFHEIEDQEELEIKEDNERQEQILLRVRPLVDTNDASVNVTRGDKYLNYKVRFLRRSTDLSLNETVVQAIVKNRMLIRTPGTIFGAEQTCRSCSLLHPLTTSCLDQNAALFIVSADEVRSHGCEFSPQSDPIIHWPNDINSSSILRGNIYSYYFSCETALHKLKEYYGENSLLQWCERKGISYPFHSNEEKEIKQLMTKCFPKHCDVAEFVENYLNKNTTTYTETLVPFNAKFSGYFVPRVQNKKYLTETMKLAKKHDKPVVTLTSTRSRFTECVTM